MHTGRLFLLPALWIGLAAAPPYSADTKFEAGNAGAVEFLSGNRVRVAVNGEQDQDQRNRQPSWFYFRLDGVAGRELTIDLTSLFGEYNYRTHNGSGLRNMRPVYSYDDKNWTHFASSEWDNTTSTIRVRLKATGNRVWIARQPPYNTAQLAKLLQEYHGSPFLTQDTVGKTAGGRAMTLLTITNPKIPAAGKKTIWLMARQHAWESGTSWVCEGAIRFLLSPDDRAARIRDGFIFKLFPMADPDGVARGGVRFNANGYDLNRNWDTADAKRMPEIFAQRKTMLEWLDAGGRMDMFLTLHNTESADFISGPASAAALAARFSKLLDETTTFYAPKGARLGSSGAEPIAKGRMSVNENLFHERKVAAFLMEQMVDSSPKISRPPTVADRLTFGAALVRAMSAAVAGTPE